MITAYANTINAERFQPDHSGRRLALAAVRVSYLAASFDGGLVF
jgi:hypothetical protein